MIFCFESKTSFKKHVLMLKKKKLLHLTPIVWSNLQTDLDLKMANSLNNFKHKLKDNFLQETWTHGTKYPCLLTLY